VAAAAAFAAGVVIGNRHGADERAVALRYVRDWARGDFHGMYALLDAGSRERLSEPAFAAAYASAALTATLQTVSPGHAGPWRDGVVPVAMTVRTRLFGILHEPLAVPVSGGGHPGVRFAAALVFPGLRRGERLRRRVELPPRAALLAADGSVLAAGPQRSSTIPDVAGAIAGVLGPIPAAERARYERAGYPPGARVGLDGLERIFQTRLAGTPGGTLLAGTRVLARRRAVAGGTVRTTIVPAIERAILAAMAGRYAGVVALDPRTGAVLGAAGVAFSAPQPPGSTMKIITATGLLEHHLVGVDDVFPVQTEATIDGFPLQNANGEACGGTLIEAFAASCNSVFAPLGLRLGAARLLEVARRFGFNQPSAIATEPASTIPPASLRDPLELAASAIGQGKVQASALQMADVAAAIAMGGRRPVPTLLAGQPPRFVTVTTPPVAAMVQRMMIAVVTSGTGTAAQISGVEVAGKTGTAELRTTVPPKTSGKQGGASAPPPSSPADTDAWFVGYAPAGAPRIVVGALFPGQGAGGATAAPAAREVLLAGLQSAGG